MARIDTYLPSLLRNWVSDISNTLPPHDQHIRNEYGADRLLGTPNFEG